MVITAYVSTCTILLPAISAFDSDIHDIVPYSGKFSRVPIID